MRTLRACDEMRDNTQGGIVEASRSQHTLVHLHTSLYNPLFSTFFLSGTNINTSI
jgi:hypothetical protein